MTETEIVEAFLSTTRTPNTRRVYKTSINQFQVFLAKVGKSLEEDRISALTRDDIRAFADWLRNERNCRPSTVSVYSSGVVQFLEWAIEQKWVDFEPGQAAALLEELAFMRGRASTRQFVRASEDAVERLFEALDGSIAEPSSHHMSRRVELYRLRNRAAATSAVRRFLPVLFRRSHLDRRKGDCHRM